MKTTTFLYLCVLCLWCVAVRVPAQDVPKIIEGPGSTLSQAPRPAKVHAPRLPYGLELMAHFDLLPLLRNTKCVQDSSYDRSGGNGDAGHFLRKEGNKSILSDIRGPGCIYRFWSANAAGHLKIFFDGEAAPRIDCPMQDLFLGKVTPFVKPLVGHLSGGWYCFFPMPFQKGCRIEVTDPGSMYYHVQYQLFSDNTPVTSFSTKLSKSDQTALGMVRKQWENMGSDPKEALFPPLQNPNTDFAWNTELAPGETKQFNALKFAGQINAITLNLSNPDRYTLRQVVLRAYWDGATKPAIEAPIGDFFGAGFGDLRFNALPMAMQDKGYACYFPMPFHKSARFELFNAGMTRIPQISLNFSCQKHDRIPKDALYFHSQWHRQTTVTGEYFHILQTTGRGHYVGEHTDMQGDHGIGFLEGDEKVYVDGETFPSIYGTGTEDFYTGGWYFDQGPFSLAYHGCVLKSDPMSRISAYRYQIQDCVPFQHDFKIDIEHGGTNDYPGADYSCVAYWYQDSPGHDWSPIDVARLNPAHMTLSGSLEAETLTWTGGKTQVMDDNSLPVEVSGGKVMAVSGQDAAFTVQVKNPDIYRVVLSRLLLSDSSPPEKVTLNGTEIGLFHSLPDSSPSQPLRLDSYQLIELKPGANTFGLAIPSGNRLYLDYVRLEPSRKEKGVLEAESLIEKAEMTGTGRVSRAPINEAFSGYSALLWEPRTPDATLKLPVNVTNEGDYILEIGIGRLPNSPLLTARLDDGEPMPVMDSATPGAKSAKLETRTLRLADGLHLTPGSHSLTLTYKGVSAADATASLALDYIRLQRRRYANSVEAESLKILGSKDGDTSVQEMRGFGPDWSGDAQFWFTGQKAGAEATLELPVQTAGRYTLVVYFTTAKDYGAVQTLVDGNPVGVPTDCYTENVRAKGRTALGAIDLTAGMHRITFRSVSKNTASSNYLIGVDAVGLEPMK